MMHAHIPKGRRAEGDAALLAEQAQCFCFAPCPRDRRPDRLTVGVKGRGTTGIMERS